MDYLKTRAPFWKKEATPAGARWVDARASDDDAAARWERAKHAMTRAALIAIDWGTTSARAYRMSAAGERARHAQRAARHLAASQDGRFGDALSRLLGDWRDEKAPRIACGMIGSRQGWVEAPYIAVPRAPRPRLRTASCARRDGELADRARREHARRERHSGRHARRGNADRRRGRGERGARAGRAARHAQQVGVRRVGTHRRFHDVHDRRDLARLLAHSILGRLAVHAASRQASRARASSAASARGLGPGNSRTTSSARARSRSWASSRARRSATGSRA